jgi:hypothetical protein
MVLPVACGSSESGASYRILWWGRIDKCVWGYRFRAAGSYPQIYPHEAPAAPGSGWTFLDILKSKKPAARGFSGHYWTTLDTKENPLVGRVGVTLTPLRPIVYGAVRCGRVRLPPKLPPENGGIDRKDTQETDASRPIAFLAKPRRQCRDDATFPSAQQPANYTSAQNARAPFPRDSRWQQRRPLPHSIISRPPKPA